MTNNNNGKTKTMKSTKVMMVIKKEHNGNKLAIILSIPKTTKANKTMINTIYISLLNKKMISQSSQIL
jgi:hypothetical protein